jgi:hypothetical protein
MSAVRMPREEGVAKWGRGETNNGPVRAEAGRTEPLRSLRVLRVLQRGGRVSDE